MQGLWTNATSPIILPITMVMGFLALYWIIFALGFLSFDTDLAEVDFDVDADSHSGVLGGISHYLHIGEMPFMIIFSILTSLFWLLSLLATRLFNPEGVFALGLGLMAGSFFIAVLATHYISLPVKKLFRALDVDVDKAPAMVGITATVVTSKVTSDFGRVEYVHKGAPLTVEARSESLLQKGDQALILEIIDKKKRIFKVTKQETTKLEEEL